MECSAKTQTGLKDIFDKAIKIALKNKASSSSDKKGCGCSIM